MSELNNIVALLGEENAEQLKKNIVEIITKQVKDDLENYGQYLIYPPDMRDMMDEAIHAVEKKVVKMYKDAVIEINQDYINKMKEYMGTQITDPAKTTRREILDLAHNLSYYNDIFGRNERIAQRLYEIIGATDEEMEGNKDEILDEG